MSVSVSVCVCVYVYGDLVYVRNAETSNKYMLYIADCKTSFWNCQDGREVIDIHRICIIIYKAAFQGFLRTLAFICAYSIS